MCVACVVFLTTKCSLFPSHSVSLIRNTENVMGQMAAIGNAEAMCGVGKTTFLRGPGTLGARWFGTACPTYQHGAKHDNNQLKFFCLGLRQSTAVLYHVLQGK